MQIEAIGDVPCDNMSSLSTRQQLDEVGVRQIEIETNKSDTEVRTHLDGIRNVNVDANTQTSCPLIDVTLPTGVSEQRSIQHTDQSIHDSESLRGSYIRSPDARIHEKIPQLECPVSVRSRSGRRMSENARIEQESFQRITTSHRREYLGESSDDAHSDRRTYGDQRPLEGGRCHGQHGRPSDRRRYEDGGYSRKGYVNRGGGPPDDGAPPDDGGPTGDGRPPNDGGPPGNGRYPRYPGRGGPPGPPGPVRPVIVQTPQVTLDTTALENTFDTMGQSMLQLARAQDQTNWQLQQHLQQGRLNMQAHTGALQQLAISTYQCNFDHIFASILIYDGSDREGFFPWLEQLEAACFYSERNIKTEALGRSTGLVQNVIMALPNARSWRAIRKELKRCFSNQTSLGHAAAQLENDPETK